MTSKPAIKNEIVSKELQDRTVFNFVDTERDLDIKSKITFKRGDKFTLFPFYQDRRTGETKGKYRKIKSFTFEGLKKKLPAGFITSPERGYGVTRQLKPFVSFVEKNLDVEDITISKSKKSQMKQNSLVININDFENIRKQISSVIKAAGEKNRTIVNNYFARIFPDKFESKQQVYQRGIINRILQEYSSIGKNLSVDDKNTLLRLFEKLSLTKKDIFEKKELIQTRDKIETRFIEDVFNEFDRKLRLKRISEEKWQEFFKENAWIFSQLFAYPAVLIKDKAYVGGKTIQDTKGKIVDFLYSNKLTRNSALIEIKKHTTQLLSKKPYRGIDVYCLSRELSGAINQALDQKDTYCKKFDSIRGKDEIEAFNPKCIVVAGRLSDLNKNQHKTFELVRSGLKDVEIITFDELFIRIKSILSIFKREEDEEENKVQAN